MRERGFLTGFLLPVTAAVAVGIMTGPRRGVGREPMNPRLRRAEENSGGSPHDARRGRHARSPGQLPARGWRDILWRVKDEIAQDHLSVIAAGIAFYAMLSIFPALGAALSLYGIVADPTTVERHIAGAAEILPEAARALITDQLAAIAQQPRASLGIGVIVGLLFSLWSASAGMQTMMTALNVVYDEVEKRSFIRFYGTALLMTLGGILFSILALSLVAALPAAIAWIGLSGGLRTAILLMRWPLLGIAVIVAIAVVYRYGPSRETPRWNWVSWGAVTATILWLLGSVLFSLYVSNFADYNKTYGALGAVIVLLMWFYISAYVVLLGAELNAEMEHQTAEDTTERGGQRLGERGAYVADTVGAVP